MAKDRPTQPAFGERTSFFLSPLLVYPPFLYAIALRTHEHTMLTMTVVGTFLMHLLFAPWIIAHVGRQGSPPATRRALIILVVSLFPWLAYVVWPGPMFSWNGLVTWGLAYYALMAVSQLLAMNSRRLGRQAKIEPEPERPD